MEALGVGWGLGRLLSMEIDADDYYQRRAEVLAVMRRSDTPRQRWERFVTEFEAPRNGRNQIYSQYQVCKIPYGREWTLKKIVKELDNFVGRIGRGYIFTML
jgi:lantibiotic modifying enzyme